MQGARNRRADLQQTKIENRRSKIAIFHPLSSILDDYFGDGLFQRSVKEEAIWLS